MEKRARLWGRGGGLPGVTVRENLGAAGGLFGPPVRAFRASIPTKYYENKTVCVFFQGASDGNAKIRRNISQKSKNNEKLNF